MTDPEDQTAEVAVALEQNRVHMILRSVEALEGRFEGEAFKAGFSLAIEEIEARWRGEAWELGGMACPLPAAPTGADHEAEMAAEFARGVAVERERCAALCEMWNATPGRRLATEIRSGTQPECTRDVTASLPEGARLHVRDDQAE